MPTRTALGIISIIFLLLPLSPAEATRSVRAIFLGRPDGALEKVFLQDASHVFEINLPGRNLSPEVSLPGGDLALAVLTDPLAPGSEVPSGTPVVKIPETWSRCILLFLPDPEAKPLSMRVIAINASQPKFPLGSTVIYNLSSARLLAKFGDKTARAEPGGNTTVAAPAAGFTSYPVAIDCLPAGEDKPRAITRTEWQHDPESRQILFVVPRENSVVPRVWGVLDRPTAVEPNGE